jgi:hypothetical protein
VSQRDYLGRPVVDWVHVGNLGLLLPYIWLSAGSTPLTADVVAASFGYSNHFAAVLHEVDIELGRVGHVRSLAYLGTCSTVLSRYPSA